MPTCEACRGDGKCRNEYHNSINEERGVIGTIAEGIFGSCEDCGSANTEMPGNCPDCGGSGEVEAFHDYVASWM